MSKGTVAINLVDTTDIGELLEVSHRTVQKWTQREWVNFPDPIKTTAGHDRIYWLPDVKAWAEETGRIPE